MRETLYPIEPALLTIFRWFIGLRLVATVGVMLLIALTTEVAAIFPLLYGVAIFAFLYLYLASNRLRVRLGKFYLPIALTVVTLALILERELIVWRLTLNWSALLPQLGIEAASNPLLATVDAATLDNHWPPLLYVPLVLIAWQYNFRSVLLFMVATLSGYLALNVLLYPTWQPSLVELVVMTVGRMLAFGVVGYAVSYLANALRSQRTALHAANARLVNHLTVQEQLATSQERNRLARELHDTLAHSLSATTIQLEACTALWESNPTKAHDLAEQALHKTRTGLAETRRALSALRAAPLDDLGLLLSLRQLAEEAAARAGYVLDLDLPVTLDALSPQVEQTIYRCTQEALANIARHAAAQHVTLRLVQHPVPHKEEHKDELELTIIDDGRGFDPAGVDERRSYGLRGMQERIAMMGGRLAITSQVGEGTTVQLAIATRVETPVNRGVSA